MPRPLDPELYAEARAKADRVYRTHGAYKSAYIVKKYKELGGRYADDGKPRNLTRWLREKWVDVGNRDYPVYRPTVRVSSRTPVTLAEVDPADLRKQIALKQKLGSKMLPKFRAAPSKKAAAPGVARKPPAAGKTSAKKATAKKAPAKKTTAKKASAKKATAKKATAKKATTKKAAAKKATAKKATAKKATTKKATAKKATAKKASAKKATAKKAAAKKATAKKATTKKATTKKASAKKATAKKPH